MPVVEATGSAVNWSYVLHREVSDNKDLKTKIIFSARFVARRVYNFQLLALNCGLLARFTR